MNEVEKLEPSKFDLEYSRYLGNLSDLEYFSDMLDRSHEWTSRISLDEQAAAEVSAKELYGSVQEKRDALAEEILAYETTYMNELKTSELEPWIPSSAEINQLVTWYRFQKRFGLPLTLAKYAAGKDESFDTLFLHHLPNCVELEDIQTSNLQRYTVVATPDDNDTDQQLDVLFETPDPYGRDKIVHKAYIHDKTHWYKTDGNERFNYWAALRYEFPAPACPSMLVWNTRVWHNVSLWGAAELRKLRTEWLLAPKPGQPPNIDPTSLQDFWRRDGFKAHNPNGADGVSVQDYFPYIEYEDDESNEIPDTNVGRVGGVFILESGQHAKIWLGIHVVLTGRENTAATGWNHFFVQGVQYSLLPLS